MLISTIDILNSYVEASSGLTFLSVSPSIELAESKYLLPLFGRTFFEEVTDYVSTPTPSDPIGNVFVTKLQRALASLAMYEYIPISDVQVTDLGVRRGNSESAPGAYKYQVQELQKSLLNRGLLYLEEMLEYMDTEIDEDFFTTWRTSVEFAHYRKLLIRNGKEFEQYYSGLKHPKRTFMLLRSTCLNVQELAIAPAISDDVYNDLVTHSQTSTPSFSDEDEILMSYLRPAIAHLTIARGIMQLSASMDENGVHVLTQFNDPTAESSKRAAASPAQLTLMMNDAEKIGQAWLNKAIDYLNATASETLFPTWYEAMQNADAPVAQNDELYGCFGL